MNINEVILSKLKLNCLWNKFGPAQYRNDRNVDVLLISETKIDSSFTSTHIQFECYETTCRLGKNSNGAGIQLYIRVNIPLMLLTFD